jgi:rsbT co-antagonist protein RsbR
LNIQERDSHEKKGASRMATELTSKIPEILARSERDILEEWLREQLVAITLRKDLLPEADLRRESAEFLSLFAKAISSSTVQEITTKVWTGPRDFLARLSRSRASLGFTPSETATFVLSLKQPLFVRLQEVYAKDAAALSAELWTVTSLLDKLGLWTAETFLSAREEIIKRQQEEMLELSTPVVKLWDGILALPMIGTLDSARTQVVMESLLKSLVDTGSEIAIVDITGVPAVDTVVAQHLLKTVAAARLMGAQCIISGIRPQIAQTMVHLGVAFGDVVTRATLADALAYAFKQLGLSVTRRQA